MGQASLFGEAAHPDLVTPIATQVAALEAAPDDSPKALHAKQQAWDMLESSDQVAHASEWVESSMRRASEGIFIGGLSSKNR